MSYQAKIYPKKTSQEPPGYVSIELEHDLDDDVFEQSYFGYEYDMFKSFPKASPSRWEKIFSGTIFITSLPWLLFGGWGACEEQRGTSKTPWDQSFEEPIRLKTEESDHWQARWAMNKSLGFDFMNILRWCVFLSDCAPQYINMRKLQLM